LEQWRGSLMILLLQEQIFGIELQPAEGSEGGTCLQILCHPECRVGYLSP
jgi:hypothetical protein